MRPPKKKKTPPVRLSPARRLEELKLLLRSGWSTPADAMERLAVSRATAFRLVATLEKTERVERETIEGKLRWRIARGAGDVPLRISSSQMVALSFVRGALGFLRGTGLDDDLADVFDRLALHLKKSDYELYKNLDRKLYDVNEAAHDYSDKLDVVNDVITALLREERLTLTLKDGTRTKVDPYTLVLYKKGLYLDCWSHLRGAHRSHGLDKIVETERHAGETFDYPDSWDPATAHRGPWGLIRGKKVRVVVPFDAHVADFVTRRNWHETQRFEREASGRVRLLVDPEGAEEMFSWVLSFGAAAEVVEPIEMRKRIAAELRKAAARYEDCEG